MPKSKRKSKLPTKDEMKAFSARFNDAQWKKCIAYPTFVEAVSVDLKYAERVAIEILRNSR